MGILLNNKIFFNSALLVLILVYTPIEASEFAVEPTILHFNYKEFSKDGALLDEERGAIEGLTVRLLNTFKSNWSGDIHLTFADGDVDYIGQTQIGQAHETSTHERLIRLGVGVQKTIPFGTRFIAFALDFSRHSWERDIKPNKGVLGLFEAYQWWEIEARLKLLLAQWSNSDVVVGVSLFKTLNPQVTVDLSETGLGKQTLFLGEDLGHRLYLTWKWNAQKKWYWGVQIEYSEWNFGSSDTKNISGPSGLIGITEPESESRHTSFQLLLGKRF